MTNNSNSVAQEVPTEAQNEAPTSEVIQAIEALNKNLNAYYFKSPQGGSFIRFIENGVQKIFAIDKNSFSDFVIKKLRHFGFRGGRNRDLANRVIDEMLGLCLDTDSKEEVSVRVGRSGDDLFVDLGDENGTIVRITPNAGFTLVKESPINFLRPSHQLPLPVPVKMDKFEFMEKWHDLFKFKNKDGNYLLLAYVLQSLIPKNGAFPILILQGPQASGKSTTSRRIKMLIDPSTPLLSGLQRSEDDLFLKASQEHLLAYDNLSRINGDFADIFCRFSTGGGHVKRQLFTNSALMVFDIQRPLLFNGILELSERPDFLDRSIILYTTQLLDSERKIDSAVSQEFEITHPKLLGGLYGILSEVLGKLDDAEKNGLPRMGDYVRIGLILDKVLGYPEGHFLKLYQNHVDHKLHDMFESSPFCLAIEAGLNKSPSLSFSGETTIPKHGYLEGSLTTLYNFFFKSKPKGYGTDLPNGPKTFRGYLERYKPVLDSRGIDFGELPRTSTSRGFYIKFKSESYSQSYLEEILG